MVFSVYRSSLMSPLTYIRFIGHVFGHAGWEHFIGNITLILGGGVGAALGYVMNREQIRN